MHELVLTMISGGVGAVLTLTLVVRALADRSPRLVRSDYVEMTRNEPSLRVVADCPHAAYSSPRNGFDADVDQILVQVRNPKIGDL